MEKSLSDEPADLELVGDEERGSPERIDSSTSGDVLYGHNMRYWRDANGRLWYLFTAGGGGAGPMPTSEGMACGRSAQEIPWGSWDHYSTGRHCPGGTGERFAIVKFVRR